MRGAGSAPAPHGVPETGSHGRQQGGPWRVAVRCESPRGSAPFPDSDSLGRGWGPRESRGPIQGGFGTQHTGSRSSIPAGVFSTRPQNNRVRFALAVRVEPRSPSDSVPNGLRDRIAANLRQHISSQLGDYLATRSTVAAFTFSLVGDGEGEPEFEEILRALEKLKGVEPVLTHWCDAQLPALLASAVVP